MSYIDKELDMLFYDDRHEAFFIRYMGKCQEADVYHMALIYCIGISQDTREHVDSIYDFHSGEILTDCLQEGWITSGSAKVVRMAFSLYTNGMPSVYDYDNTEEQMEESSRYSAQDLFCCGYADCFWQAIKLRYPEYC